MRELNFDDGLVTYTVNGKCQVSFNPTDSNFVEKLYLAFEDLDKKQEGYKAQIEKMGDKKQIFTFARERDHEMRDIINSVFDAPIADDLFGDRNVYALAEGVPVAVCFQPRRERPFPPCGRSMGIVHFFLYLDGL